MARMKHGDIVKADGDVWNVVAVGATENDATYVHLASRTRSVLEKNRVRPIQVCGWLSGDTLTDAP